jgi:hypothetical protein
VKITINENINDIVRINEHIRDFWGAGACGWAPARASELLSKSRLDRQVSLSRTLRHWTGEFNDDEADGQLILAWANLGSLLEGTMKWFLCVFASDYEANPVKLPSGKELDPDELFFGRMCGFFRSVVWTKTEVDRWSDWVDKVRQRRNTIHAYRDSTIGTFEEFREAVIEYRDFLLECERSVPYPDEQYGYPYDILEMRLNSRRSGE